MIFHISFFPAPFIMFLYFLLKNQIKIEFNNISPSSSWRRCGYDGLETSEKKLSANGYISLGNGKNIR